MIMSNLVPFHRKAAESRKYSIQHFSVTQIHSFFSSTRLFLCLTSHIFCTTFTPVSNSCNPTDSSLNMRWSQHLWPKGKQGWSYIFDLTNPHLLVPSQLCTAVSCICTQATDDLYSPYQNSWRPLLSHVYGWQQRCQCGSKNGALQRIFLVVLEL